MAWCGLMVAVGVAGAPPLERVGLPYDVRAVGGPFLEQGIEVQLVADLDRDGADELVVDLDVAPGQREQTLEVRDTDGRAVLGVFTFPCDHGPTGHSALDVDGDGFPEIVFSYVVDDSLFLVVLDRNARPLGRILAARRSACPSSASARHSVWAPGLAPQAVVDCDGDGFLDIVACGSAGYWLHPRGVWALSWARQEVIWHHATGAVMRDAVVVRAPGAQPRIVASSYAAANGAVLNGTDDSHSYVIVLSPTTGELVHRHITGSRAFVGTHVRALDGVGASPLVMTVTACGDLSGLIPAVISTWHGAGDSVACWVEAGFTDTDVLAADVDGDGGDELLLATRVGELLVYGPELSVKARVAFGGGRSTVCGVGDLTGDRRPEVLVQGTLGTVVIDPRKKAVLAVLQGGGTPWILRRGRDEPVLLKRGPAGWTQYVLVPNATWEARGVRCTVPTLLGVAAGLLFVGAAAAGLRRGKPVLPTLLDHGMALLDRRGRMVAVNHAMSRVLGLDETLLPGTPFCEVAARAGFDPPLRRSGCACDLGEWVRLSRNGVDPGILLRCVPVGRHTLVEARLAPDTPSRRARLAWSTMAPRVAHDLKSPLSTLTLATERAIRQIQAGTEPSHELMRAVLDHVERIDRLTRNFLKLAELEGITPTPVGIGELVAELAEGLQARNIPGVRVERRIEPDLPPVWVDREQLMSALENLVENALAAVGEEGTITISAHRVSSLPGGALVDDAVEIEIADTGQGIAPQDLPRIFDVGFTRRPGGSGLGLAIVRQVVDQHHGHVEVHSEVGIGTTVIIYLPVKPPLGDCRDGVTAR